MTFYFRLPLLLLLLFLLPSSLSLSVVHAEAVYKSPPPTKKALSKKKHKKRSRAKRRLQKKGFKKPNSVVFGLYVTFVLLILLPLLVLLGTLVVAFGFPNLLLYSVGVGMIGLGNIGVLLAGIFTGRTSTYNTQALFFAVWVLFGINLAAALAFALLYTVAFASASLLLFLTIGVAVIALIFLLWGALITRQKKAFKRASKIQPKK
jgi:hypothetical protein